MRTERVIFQGAQRSYRQKGGLQHRPSSWIEIVTPQPENSKLNSTCLSSRTIEVRNYQNTTYFLHRFVFQKAPSKVEEVASL